MTDGSNIVTIRDIDVPFWRIVLILVKWAIAAIPAMIILTLLVAILGALFAELLGFLGLDLVGSAGVANAAIALNPSAPGRPRHRASSGARDRAPPAR